MRITFHQCRVFETVAHEKSITKAAKKIFLSQPAVSNLIKQVEETLGTELIKVVGKTIYLTVAGEKFLAACIDIRHRLEKLDYEITNLNPKKFGKLSICVVTTAKYFVPKLLGEFKKSYPNIKIDLHVVNRRSAITRLKDNLDDFVIMSQPPQDKNLIISDFFQDKLVVVASSSNQLSSLKKVRLKDIENQDWIMREDGSGTKIAVDNILKEKEVQPNISMHISNNESIKQLLIANMGIAIIPLQSIELELKMGYLSILDVIGFPINHEWYLVKRKSRKNSPIVDLFLKYIENYDKVNLTTTLT